MKKEITKFDLDSAFKALDEVSYPDAQGFKPNKINLEETFVKKQKVDLLMEDYYNLADQNDLQAAKEAEIAKAKLDRIERIVDLDADSEEDLLPSYVGKVIVQCPQCLTLFYKNPEDLVYSENDPEVVNEEETCQHCGNTSGYTVIGKVAAEDHEEEIPEEEVPEEETGDEDNYDEENTSEEELEDEDALPRVDDDSDESEDLPDFDEDEDSEEEDEDEEEKPSKKEESFNGTKSIDRRVAFTERIKSKMLARKEKETRRINESAGKNNLNEEDDFDSLFNSKEFKTPISDEEVQKYLEEGKEDLELDGYDEIDEQSLNSCITESLKKVFENVKYFKSTNCVSDKHKLIVEGIIGFKSNKIKDTKFVFEALSSQKAGNTIKLQGINESLGTGSRFNLRCSIDVKNNKLQPKSVMYSYTVGKNLVEGFAFSKNRKNN